MSRFDAWAKALVTKCLRRGRPYVIVISGSNADKAAEQYAAVCRAWDALPDGVGDDGVDIVFSLGGGRS